MKWLGVRDDSSIIGEGLLTCQNISFCVDGEARRRSTLDDRLDAGGQLITELSQPSIGPAEIAFTSGGKLQGTLLAGGTTTDLATGLNATNRGCFMRHNGRVYFTNDFDPVKVIERSDAACASAGIAAPTGAIGAPTQAAGSCDIGNHLVRYRYLNSKTGYVSNPSDAITVTIAATTKQLTFSIGLASNIIPSTDTKVDTIAVEMAAVNGTAYYRATTALNTAATVVVSISDASLIQQIATDSYHGDFGHEVPPVTSMVCEHRGRVFFFGTTEITLSSVTVTNGSATVTGTGFSPQWAGRLMMRSGDTRSYVISAVNAGGTTITLTETYAGTTSAGAATVTFYHPAPDTLLWSRSGYPEATKHLEWARRVLQNSGDTPAGMASFYGDLYLLGQHSMRVLDYTSDPASGKLVNIPGDMGVFNQQCLVQANGQLYGLCRSGAWVIDGILPKHVSSKIDPTMWALVDFSAYAKFHGVYDPRERVIQWFYCRTGETDPKDSICLDIDSGEWSTRRYRQAIVASCQATKTAKAVRVLVSDSTPKSWYLELDRVGDGIPVTQTTGIVTVSSATSTVVTTAESVMSTSPTLVGAVVYRVSTAEERTITANTATTFTTTAWGTTPTAGESFYIGSVDIIVKLKWWTGDGLRDKKRASYLSIGLIPGTSAGKWTAKIYQDFSGTPLTLTSFADDTRIDGVIFSDQGTSFTIDDDAGAGDGYVTVPLSADWRRALTAQMQSITPVDTPKLLDLAFLKESPRSEVDEDAE